MFAFLEARQHVTAFRFLGGGSNPSTLRHVCAYMRFSPTRPLSVDTHLLPDNVGDTGFCLQRFTA